MISLGWNSFLLISGESVFFPILLRILTDMLLVPMFSSTFKVVAKCCHGIALKDDAGMYPPNTRQVAWSVEL